MSPNIVVGIAFILAGLLIGFAGYQIRYKGQLNLIAGYDPNRVKDKEGMARWVGNGIIFMGIVQAICGIVALLLVAAIPFAAISFFLVSLLTPLFLMTRIAQYTK